ncbi:ribosome small subunit-dependent GTPase A [Chitinibacter bivalviorum]|uniref:Small ribosomal subunit biogenesis GTPase RsgA n=1 Tax=Chitinibacter bivalviorum TaxID=2739434 RepID=A0A7H9BIG5_9NEIS|nr:ribosome small subunit-dependent GTPase A [Chitinibacter bivalviorum]QLG88076.1 ribosome small subunit-dependent GTPase A [Chitinibacter bivalviorum]
MTATTARIVTSYGKVYIVELDDGRRLSASTRGKKTDYACGDRVAIDVLNAEQAVINKALERKTLLYRSDQWKSKLIAANVTQIIIVVASVPSFSDELIGRALLAAADANIRAVICLNKCDLPESDAARERLAYYKQFDYPVVEISAKQDLSPLMPWLDGQISVLVGQSGMGKSTITNALIPEANARVNEISVALDSGKHTTTHAQLYKLNETAELIDSPGLQSFGLAHMRAESLPHLMADMSPHVGQCRFSNCRHRQEPGCAILSAVAAGEIAATRLELMHRLQDEIQLASTNY